MFNLLYLLLLTYCIFYSSSDKWLLTGWFILKNFASSNIGAEILPKHVGVQTEMINDMKRKIFTKVLDWTKKLPSSCLPFLPLHFDDVIKAIYNQLLVGDRPEQQIIEACQLLNLMLTNEKRRRFKALLKFLKACGVDTTLALTPEVTFVISSDATIFTTIIIVTIAIILIIIINHYYVYTLSVDYY